MEGCCIELQFKELFINYGLGGQNVWTPLGQNISLIYLLVGYIFLKITTMQHVFPNVYAILFPSLNSPSLCITLFNNIMFAV